MKKKLLLVSYFSPPLINAESILVWKTVNELSSSFDVNIISSPVGSEARVDPQMTLRSNIDVYRKKTFKPRNQLLRKATDRALGWITDEHYPWASFSKPANLDCDLIYSRSHPGASHILALKLKRELGKPWLAQFSDPWTLNPYHTNHSALRKSFDSHWERQVIKNADFFVFPTKEIADMYNQTYTSLGVEEKSIVLPHHYLPELYQQDLSATPRLSPNVSFAYFGDFYGLRSPEPFLQALRAIATQSPKLLSMMDVHFYGNVETRFIKMIEEAPINIGLHKVTYFESLRYMAMTDILLLIDAPSKNGINPFLPSKLIDYLGAGNQILGITDTSGTAADILRKYDHEVVSPGQIKDIVGAITKYMMAPKTPIKPPVEFATKTVVGRLAHILNELSTDSLSGMQPN